ncbi:MAG: hypothetical protein ACKVQB_09985 [Bacteroidia bacterium]
MAGLGSVFQSESKKMKLIMVLFLVVYHLTLFYSLSNEPVLLRDSEEYLNSAKNFETERTFYSGQSDVRDFRMYSKRTPFYPLVLYSFKVLNLHWNFVYLIQAFLGLLNIFLALLLLKQLVKTATVFYLLLSIFILFTPSQFIYSQFIMADLWLQTFAMLCFISFAMFLKKRNTTWLVSLILFSTLAALAKPVFLLASLGIGGFCAYYFILTKGKRVLIFLAVVPFFSWVSLSSFNKNITGLFHYSSIGYINLLHYNTNLYLNKAIGKTETYKLLDPLMIVPHTKHEFKKNYSEVNGVCRKAILSHLLGYSLFHFKGMFYFFLDPGRFDLFNFFRLEKENSTGFLHKGADENRLRKMFSNHPVITISLGFIFLINIIKTMGFLGLVWVQRKNRLVWAGAALVFYIALLTGPLGASRFALPVELIIICFAAVFYGNLFQSLKLGDIIK